MKNAAFHAIVHGRVQRVSFRKFTQQAARDLGLVGWVRNLPDGTVETVAEGDTAALDKLESWLRTTGSPASRIDEVKLEWADPTNSHRAFEIAH
jgi:acylphosphatase